MINTLFNLGSQNNIASVKSGRAMSTLPFHILINYPKFLGVFFIKTASKQPLFKARWILQTWGLF
jgi:hypothetical protein